MNKIFLRLLVVPMMLGASIASAEVGGTITRSIDTPAATPENTPVETVIDKTNPDIMLINKPVDQPAPVVSTTLAKSVNALITGILQMVEWQGENGKLTFTATNYSINNGCNTIFGTYKVNVTNIELGAGASTLMACEQKLMDQDQALIKDLANVTKINFVDGKLVLSGKNTQLKFAPHFVVKK